MLNIFSALNNTDIRQLENIMDTSSLDVLKAFSEGPQSIKSCIENWNVNSILIDSGAYTIFTKNIKLNIDDYINCINEVDCDKVWGYLNMDVICTDPSKTTETSLKSIENYKYIVNNVTCPNKIIPVFHIKDPVEHIREYLNYVLPDGTTPQYIAIGGIAVDSQLPGLEDLLYNLIQEIKKIKPDIKIHLLGVGSKRRIQLFGNMVYSIDSTCWVGSRFGRMYYNWKDYSYVDFKLGCLPIDIQKQLEDRYKSHNMDILDSKNIDYNNILDFLQFTLQYCEEPKYNKNDLWG